MAISLNVSAKGNLVRRLQQRAQLWRLAKLGATITVPPELEWWYWQEFGTASRGEAGGSEYVIEPVTAQELRFPQGGSIQFRSKVNHPGIRPRRAVTKVLPEVVVVLSNSVPLAFDQGAIDDPSILQGQIVDATNQVKALIVQSMAENIPGLRELEPERGRLGGQTAAEAFEAAAQVVENP